ncbi:hypothetical protein DFJ77DRAFT_433484 [Powellomyces hirtus]|nr:hypothetical protein DFJ77DRAFT_433484 [Powellomyces hirtus]
MPSLARLSGTANTLPPLPRPTVASSSGPSTFTKFALSLPIPLLLWFHQLQTPIECSPTFQGVPVAATFLMHQALPRFDKKFPGLELSAVFDMARPEEYVYKEEGLFASVMPSTAIVEVPIFEKLSQVEEAKLGGAGIRKKPVGKVQLKGACSLGCAKVELTEMRVLKNNGDVVWEWKKKGV